MRNLQFTTSMLAFMLVVLQAGAEPSPQIGATALRADGLASFTGTLSALGAGDPDQSVATSFMSARLDSPLVHVVTDHDQTNITAATFPVTESWVYATSQDYHDVVLQGGPPEPDAYAFIAPTGDTTLTITARVIEATNGQADLRQAQRVHSDRDLLESDQTGPSIDIPEGGWIRIQGSFILAVWDWNLQAHEPNQTTTIKSGEERTDTVPGTPVAKNHRRQVYIHVEEGVLELEISDPGDLKILVAEGELQNQGTTTLRGATGPLQTASGTLHLDGQELRAPGTSRLALRPGGDDLAVTILEADDLEVDGEPVVLAVKTDTAPIGVWLAIAAAAALLGFIVWLRRGPEWTFNKLERAFDRGQFTRSIHLGQRAMRRGRNRPQATVLTTISLLKKRRVDEAMMLLEEEKEAWQRDNGDREFLLAQVHALRRQPEEAQRLLRTAIAKEESWYQEAFLNPILRPLLATGGNDVA